MISPGPPASFSLGDGGATTSPETVAPLAVLDEAGPGPRRGRLASWLAPESPVPVYLGVVLIAVGFAVLAYTWGRVAGTLSIALQLPYIASGGFTGLALVVLGATVVSIGAKRRDAALRGRQLDELSALLLTIAHLVGQAGADEDGTE